MSFRDERAQLAGLCLAQKCLQISARNKNRFFGGRDDDALERIFLFNKIELLIEIGQSRGVENIGARFRTIEGQQANSIINLPLNHWSSGGDAHRNSTLANFGRMPSEEQAR